MIYEISRQEFETVAHQLLLQEELSELDLLLLDNDIDELIINSSDQKSTTIILEGDKLFVNVRQGIFKSLL